MIEINIVETTSNQSIFIRDVYENKWGIIKKPDYKMKNH